VTQKIKRLAPLKKRITGCIFRARIANQMILAKDYYCLFRKELNLAVCRTTFFETKK
jgi:hypothetical protein